METMACKGNQGFFNHSQELPGIEFKILDILKQIQENDTQKQQRKIA